MAWLIIATVASYMLKGLCGFGEVIVFSSILSFRMNNSDISPISCFLSYPADFIIASKYHKLIKLPRILPYIIMIAAGNVVGGFILKNADAGIIKRIFGLVVIVIALFMLSQEYKHIKVKENKVVSIIVGIVSGVLCGMYGIATIMAAYLNMISDDSEEFKANLSAIFVVTEPVRVFTYLAFGLFTRDNVMMAVVMIPFMLVSLFIGLKGASLLHERAIKIITIIVLIIMGATLGISG